MTIAERWHGFWRSPDPRMRDAGARGEVAVARIRLAAVLLLGLIPVSASLRAGGPQDVAGLAIVVVAAVAAALVIRAALSRRWPRLGLITGLLDVTLISLALATYLVLGRPWMAVNSRVTFLIYFLAIAATALRYDHRLCLLVGGVAIAEYLAVVFAATAGWDVRGAAFENAGYGRFEWGAQINRVFLLGIAALFAVAVVRRTQRLLVAIQSAEREYRDVVDSAVVGIFQSSPSGHILMANPALASILGYASADAMLSLRMVPDVYDDPTEREALIARISRTGYVGDTELRWRRSDGAPIWIRMDARAVNDPQGRLLYFEGFVQDVTKRREAEEAAGLYRLRLAELSRRLIAAQEEERGRLARELHDELGQALTALKLRLLGLSRNVGSEELRTQVGGSLEIVQDTMARVRDLAQALRPPLLDDMGLETAIRWQAERMAKGAGFQVVVSARGLPSSLSPERTTACFRVAQEALTNVARHAEARAVRIDIVSSGDELRLTVSDDGRGFDVVAGFAGVTAGKSMGLVGMQQRVRLLGGRFRITSQPGRGTVIEAALPVSADLPAGVAMGEPS